MESSTYCIIVNVAVAVGTILVAVAAIWGDLLRSKLAAPQLRIDAYNLRGTCTRFTNGPRVMYYHLKVVNTRNWAAARNCRVILRSVLKRLPNQQFGVTPLAVPSQFVWAPAEITPASVTLSTEHTLDFGRVAEGSDRFEPVLYIYPNDFPGFVRAGEAVRYVLQVEADGFVAKQLHVFEVAWDGRWSDNLDSMARYLTIHEVKPEEAGVTRLS